MVDGNAAVDKDRFISAAFDEEVDDEEIMFKDEGASDADFNSRICFCSAERSLANDASLNSS